MATFTGHSGEVSVGSNVVAEVKDFSIEVTANTVDATTLVGTNDSDEGWTRTKIVNRSWTVSINCFFDDQASNGQLDAINNINQSPAAMLVGNGVAISCTAGGDTYSGFVHITSFSKSVSGDGLIEASFTATGQGELTIA